MKNDGLCVHARWIVATAINILRWRKALLPRTVTISDRVRLTLLVAGLLARLVRVPAPLSAFVLMIEGRRRQVRVANHHEFAGAVEVLCTPDYEIPLEPPNVRKVIDLGANVGFATLRFAGRYPDAQIVAVEPAPDTFARLTRNVGHLPNVTLMPLAAGAPGRIYLDLCAPSTERRGGQKAPETHVVARLSVSELLAQLGWSDIDVLKVDIEGDEYALLAQPSIARARVIVGELHTAAAPCDFEGLECMLPGFDVTHGPLDAAEFVMFRAVRRA